MDSSESHKMLNAVGSPSSGQVRRDICDTLFLLCVLNVVAASHCVSQTALNIDSGFLCAFGCYGDRSHFESAPSLPFN
jgi:hypothetical protein